MPFKVVLHKEFVAPMGPYVGRLGQNYAVCKGAPCVQIVSIECITIFTELALMDTERVL